MHSRCLLYSHTFVGSAAKHDKEIQSEMVHLHATPRLLDLLQRAVTMVELRQARQSQGQASDGNEKSVAAIVPYNAASKVRACSYFQMGATMLLYFVFIYCLEKIEK